MIALTRPPSAGLARCELTHLARAPIDVERAREQHAAYRECLARLGVEVVVLPEEPDLPDAVFVEDTAVVLDEVAVVTRPGAPSRRAETAGVARALERWRPLVHLAEPATLDGGDVVRAGHVLFVGQSTRTNHAGLKQLAHVVLEHGYRVKAVEVAGCLHLESAVTSLGGDRLIADPRRVDVARFRGCEVLEVHPDEPQAANVLHVRGTVVLPAGADRTAERVAAAGYDVRLLDASELQKAEGALTCQSLRFEERV